MVVPRRSKDRVCADADRGQLVVARLADFMRPVLVNDGEPTAVDEVGLEPANVNPRFGRVGRAQGRQFSMLLVVILAKIIVGKHLLGLNAC